MALATLYTEAVGAKLLPSTCHAFIIDHKARPESAEEAQWVAEQLRSRCEYAHDPIFEPPLMRDQFI